MIDRRRLRFLVALACLWGVGWGVPGCGVDREPIEEAPPSDIAADEEPTEPPAVLVKLGLFCLPDSEIDELTFIADPWARETVVIIAAGDYGRFLKELDLAPTAVVAASPSLAVYAGEPASITVGEGGTAAAGGSMMTGFAFEILPRINPQAESGVLLDLDYTQHVDGDLVSEWSGAQIPLGPGEVALVRLEATHVGLPVVLGVSAAVAR